VCWLSELFLFLVSLLTCHCVTRRRSDGPVLYERVRPAIGWDVPADATLFLVLRGSKWLAIHAPRGSSHAAVLGSDIGQVAFASEGNVLQAGEHDWQTQWGGEWSDMRYPFETHIVDE